MSGSPTRSCVKSNPRDRTQSRCPLLLTRAGAAPQDPPRPAVSRRRTVPPCDRSRTRAGGARPPGRHRGGFLHRRRARGCGICRPVGRPRARPHARADEPACRPERSFGAAPRRAARARHRHRRAARPRRQRRRLRAAVRRRAIRVYTPHGGSLHYSRSSPVGLLYLDARTGADGADRAVPVREPLRPRCVHRQDRHAAFASCASCTMA